MGPAIENLYISIPIGDRADNEKLLVSLRYIRNIDRMELPLELSSRFHTVSGSSGPSLCGNTVPSGACVCLLELVEMQVYVLPQNESIMCNATHPMMNHLFSSIKTTATGQAAESTR